MDFSSKTTGERSSNKCNNPNKGSRETISGNQSFFSNISAENSNDNEEIKSYSFLEYVESLSKIDTIAAADISALKSYLKYCRSVRQEFSDQDMFFSWVAMLLRNGSGYHTVRRYVSFLRGAFCNYITSCGTQDVFVISDLKKVCDDYSVARDEISRRASNLKLLKKIVMQRRFYDRESETWSIFLTLLYSCASSFADVVGLRYDSISPTNYHLQDIADSCRTHAQRRYIFQLGQGKRRETQIEREIASRINALLHSLAFDMPGEFGINTIRSLWIDAAVEAGISLFEIRSIVGIGGVDDRYLQLVPETSISSQRRSEILNKVAEHINPHDEHWHVMRLRNAVTPDDIRTRTSERVPALLKRLTLYYPTREMVFKENKKIIKREMPYIPGLLFFKIGENKIAPLFREIGDLAWCYRERPSHDAPYSIIPRSEMERFQRFVGKFTEDVEVSLTGKEPLGIGRRVRITGGLMEGYEGEIYDIEESKDSASGRRMFQLNLSSDQALRWTVSVEDIYIEPIDC